MTFAPFLVVFLSFLVATVANAAAIEENTIGPSKLLLFSKALHKIAEGHCGKLIDKAELDDLQAFLHRQVSKSEIVTLEHPHHFNELYNNLTGCANFFGENVEKFLATNMDGIQMASTTAPSEQSFVIEKAEPTTIQKFLRDPIKSIADAFDDLVKAIGKLFGIQKSRNKREVNVQTDVTNILKGMIEIAVKFCPKSRFSVQKEYLTMIGKLMALQVELGENRDPGYEKLLSEIIKCSMKNIN